MRAPWLWIPPQLAHDISPWALPVAALFGKHPQPLRPISWRGLQFINPLGIAGGVDKSGRSLLSWQKLGAGFVEVGTITPLPQGPNPGVILNRSLLHRALWNKMGFPNVGADQAFSQLSRVRKNLRVPLLVNIGKNRTTSNEDAASDYIKCLQKLAPVADAFVINISSPNTQGLRDLLTPQYLHKFFEPIMQARDSQNLKMPFLVKLSPDMTPEELEVALDTTYKLGMDGWILTNTTVSRPEGIDFPKDGGLSGEPLKELSRDNLRRAIAALGARKNGRIVISAGGVSSADDAADRLALGADLVQIYSALIFEGPWLFQKLIHQLQQNADENTLIS